MFADIVIDIAVSELDRVFQYHIPEVLLQKISVGKRVRIPFGKSNKIRVGYVIELKESSDYPEDKIKDIDSVLEDGISVMEQMITLAANIKTVYGSTMATALKTVIPVKKQVKAVERKHYMLNIPEDEARELKAKYEKDKRRASAALLIDALLYQESLSRVALIQNMGIGAGVIKGLVQSGVIREETTREYRKPYLLADQQTDAKNLNEQQRSCASEIQAHPGEVHLIHGITGSGKTEVYMALVQEVLAKGQQVIVLIPEISLTLQTVSRFYQRFGDRVSVMNSKLSQGERYDQYMRAMEGDVDIIVGPRSALFMPFANLGMIIIDEEHDGAYKSEMSPRYHAREVAIWRARMCGATVVLGSATPSLESYYRASSGLWHLHTLDKRANTQSRLADVKVVDLRDEFRLKNKKMFSRPLDQMIRERLGKKEQSMLFLNRRGFAGFVSCRSCGHVIKCKHCDVSMTAHYDGRLRCHYCGYEQPSVKLCPECGSRYIAAFGTGTQKVENMVAESYPEASVLRLDRDTTIKKDSMDQILSAFREGEADILVGTQMIVKGHDFPNVTLVGILAADLSLFAGDYQSAEKTFQLLVQAAGRAGRGEKQGDVVIQTYQPEHYCIQAAAKQDYKTFYDQEIAFRKVMHYPPFYHILVILGECSNQALLTESFAQLKLRCDLASEDCEIIGPADANLSKAKDAYRQVIYVKSKKMRTLIELKRDIEQTYKQMPANNKVYIQFDMDPMNTY